MNLPKVETILKCGGKNTPWCSFRFPTSVAEVWLGSSSDQTLPQDCESFQAWCWPEITLLTVFTILHLGKNRKGRGMFKFNFFFFLKLNISSKEIKPFLFNLGKTKADFDYPDCLLAWFWVGKLSDAFLKHSKISRLFLECGPVS